MSVWPRSSVEELISYINDSGLAVKVLLYAEIGNADSTAEGVWVIPFRGDGDNGVGLLLSNIISLGGKQPVRGDVVEYRTINKEHRPYIVAWLSGSGN